MAPSFASGDGIVHSHRMDASKIVLHSILEKFDQSWSKIDDGWVLNTDIDGSKLISSVKSSIKIDGIFDIFPEWYWSDFTCLKSVTFECLAHGDILVRLIRRDLLSGRDELVEECDSDGQASVLAINAEVLSGSFLFVEIVSSRAGSYIANGRWCTRQEAVRIPRIGVAITTYNREHFLAENLSLLRGRLAGGRIIVVNHGPVGLADRLKDVAPTTADIRFIDQENSGGAGGFIRGMLEHMSQGDITHVLLMDDDVSLLPDLVERISSVLKFSYPEVCIGGAMFDYYNRHQLFTAGDFLRPNGFGIGHIAPVDGCDIRETRGVEFLNRIHRPDFNGWWCFAFPLSALSDVGLPMRCFIRGDDVEFGYRLTRAGKPTIGWPGIAVWHMPFADKSAPWHMFYDRRNSLFANARHRRLGRMAALRNLGGGFFHHLLRYDYDRVNAMTLGIVAFNRGAAAMDAWSHHDHGKLVSTTTPRLQKDAMGAICSAPAARNSPLKGLSRTKKMAFRFVLDVFWPWRDRQPVVLATGEVWRPDYPIRPAEIIETDDRGEISAVYSYQWRMTLKSIFSCSLALLGLMKYFHQDVPISFPEEYLEGG